MEPWGFKVQASIVDSADITMPKISDRQRLIQELDELIRLSIINDDDNSDLEELMELRWSVEETRFINPRIPIPRNRSMIDMLWRYNEYDFKQEIRMCKNFFKTLVHVIENHPIFHNNARNTQRNVWEQVYITLRRLGCEGNAISIGSSSRIGGVSFGTVGNHTNRVLTGIYDMMSNLINWPNAQERIAISSRFDRNHGLKGSVGAHIILSQRPHIDGEVFWTRKHCYSINVQIVCDGERMIRGYVIGWPGSVTDSTVFKNSDIYKFPKNHFSNNKLEYLIADAGYASKSFMCTPYRQPAAFVPHNKLFNQIFSSGRVVIEHVNGILKARWSSLKGIRNQIIKQDDFVTVNKQIVVCMLLHNFLLICKDVWDDGDDVENLDDNDIEERNTYILTQQI
jgi:DDE superfamily endonuclease